MPLATVCISRSSRYWRDRIRSYRVILDDGQIGLIGSGETRDFIIEVGKHDLRLKIDWTHSQKIQFDIDEGELVQFKCQPNGNTFTGLIDLARTVRRHPRPYVNLWQVSTYKSE
jgi:hypothetical protein